MTTVAHPEDDTTTEGANPKIGPVQRVPHRNPLKE